MLGYIWLVIVFPIAGFVMIGLLGRRYLSREGIGYIACGAVLISFLLSVVSFIEIRGDLSRYEGVEGVRVYEEGRGVEVEVYEWFPSMEVRGEEFRVGMSFYIDPLSCVMILVVTGVGFLIHVYSVGYMWEEVGYYRYFSFLNLFMGMMLVLVLAGDFLLMFIGWEGVGLCSYLLIGFFFEEGWCADAGRKAFIVTRIGDFGFLIGLLLMVMWFGTLKIPEVMGMVSSGGVGGSILVTVGVLLFIGAVGKSAQIPLYVWLPDAMAGPTPVSALIHAATMVTAGVYLVCRCGVLYRHAPLALGVVGVVGGLTAIFAASIGLMQNDIKKVLAYSTVSQLGYMFLGAGVGAFGAAIFHLVTHAFFKALLFLGSGSVIHGLGGEQDIRRMGGLRRYMPVTFGTFLLGALALVGVPGFSGFFSKDEILFRSYSGSKGLWVMGLMGVGFTAFYMVRLLYLTFYGEERFVRERGPIHECPGVMRGPLIVLGVLSVIGGYIGIPKVLSRGHEMNYLERFLEPVFGGGEVMEGGRGLSGVDSSGGGGEILLMVLGVLVAFTGMYVAWEMYGRRPGWAEGMARRRRGIYGLISNKYWVDELYEVVVVRPYNWLCRRSFDFDTWIIDGAVHVTGIMTDMTGHIMKLFQTGYVRNYALYFFLGVVAIILYFLMS